MRTIERLKKANKDVIFVKSVPEYQQDVPTYLAKSLALTGQISMHKYTIDKAAYFTRNAEVNQILDELDLNSKAKFIDTYSIFCPNDTCRYISDDGDVLYSDDNHLSEAGAQLIIRQIFDGKH